MNDSPTAARQALEAFILGVPGTTPSVELLHRAALAEWAYPRAPEHPEREALRAAVLRATTRHLAVKRALMRLVRAWDARGVPAMVFKGFHVAEFAHATPGARIYADVDLLVPEERIDDACAEAASLGWHVLWRLGQPDHPLAPRSPGYRGHEGAQIRLPEIDLLIDVHRRVAHNNHNRIAGAAVQRRLTEAVWRDAITPEWEGTRLHVPSPVDAVVLGIVINRCWGSDAWWIKARDYPDVQALVERHALTRDDVLERARALGVSRTVALFLERCDPFRRTLTLGQPSWASVRRWNLEVVRERGPRDLQHLALGADEAWRSTGDVVRVLPAVRRAARRARDGAADAPGVADAPAAHDTGATSSATETATALPSSTWRSTRRAIHRSLRLLRVDPASRGAVAALAAFEVLRRRGIAVRLEARGPGEGPRLLLGGIHLEVLVPDEPSVEHARSFESSPY